MQKFPYFFRNQAKKQQNCIKNYFFSLAYLNNLIG